MQRSVLLSAATMLVTAILFISTGGAAWTQTITGTILGTVTDPSGNVIVGAKVILINEGTRDQRSASSDMTGGFVVPSLLPGAYTVRVESQGFQSYQRTGNELTASGRLSLGDIQLNVGSLTETIAVTAQGTEVQTASAEGSALLTTRQLDTVSQRGRNLVSMLLLLPGVSTSGGASEALPGGSIGTGIPNIGGIRSGLQTMSLDGQQGQDNGSTNTYTTAASPDAVQEVKVLLNNYQAEYGHGGGAVINVITKSGTREVHGTAYWYKRHEMFNANNFFNNRSNPVTPKPIYRYNTEGFTLGGPITIPKVFNTSRQKLFFFYNFERNPSLEPSSVNRTTMPTALERGLGTPGGVADYSQTLDTSGKLMVVRDPLNNNVPFVGNVIPSNRINKSGQALISVFPLPNRLDRTQTKGSYNYEFQESRPVSRTNNLFRVDYRATEKDSLYFRGTFWDSWNNSQTTLTGWGMNRTAVGYQSKHAVFGYTRILNPSAVNELNVAVRRPHERVWASSPEDLAKIQRAKVGFTAGQFYPSANWDDLIPMASFSGVSNSPSFGNYYNNRYPDYEDDLNYSIVDGLTVNRGKHTFKAGIYFEKERLITGAGGADFFMGSLSFNVDTNNPNDSGHPYGNAMLGNFSNYVETQALRMKPDVFTYDLDWYIQDSFRVTKRLTLEYGLRVQYFSPWTQKNGQQSSFALSRYNPKNAPVLYQPTLVGGKRLALNPLTGQTTFEALIGAYVPNSGDPANGNVLVRDGNYPPSFVLNAGEMLQPRFGLAWDVFGNGKTAMRAGLGKSNQNLRYQPSSPGPPLLYNPTYYYGNLATYLTGAGVLAPGSVTSLELDTHAPNIYNITFGIQQNIGLGTLLDVKYVSALGHNLGGSRNLNTLPYGTRFLAQNIDPTTNKPYSDNFLRPYPGYGSISYQEHSTSSNYHALQVSANRRLSKGFQFGAAYTYSKTMDYGSNPMYRPARIWNYALADFDQTHMLTINYTYDLPKLSKVLPNPVVRHAFDNWQVSGITSFSSGTPSGIGLSTTNSADLTGGGDGQRVLVIADPRIAHSERTIEHMFNNAAFALPGKGDPGNAPRTMVRGPGINNWDLTVFKLFPIKSEQRSLQLRWELYNLPNHTQFSGMDTGARFDPVTGAQTNGLFGTATSARSPRQMQVSLRFRF